MKEIRHLIMTKKPGVNDKDIELAEEKLGFKLPEQYRELVKLVNSAEIGEWIFHPIKDSKNPKKTWDDIVRQNKDMDVRWDNMPENLIAFASDGTGDKLCFEAEDGKLQETVYLWNHETGRHKEISSDLKEFILKNEDSSAD